MTLIQTFALQLATVTFSAFTLTHRRHFLVETWDNAHILNIKCFTSGYFLKGELTVLKNLTEKYVMLHL